MPACAGNVVSGSRCSRRWLDQATIGDLKRFTRDEDHGPACHERRAEPFGTRPRRLYCRRTHASGRVVPPAGLRLTAIRRRVLELIWANHQPTKAYDLLAQINAERGNAAPPTVYRALDFLLDAGLIHKIESQNAFIGCAVDHDRNQPKFFICRTCGRAAEIQSSQIDDVIANEAEEAGFVVDHQTIEVDGLCAACAAALKS